MGVFILPLIAVDIPEFRRMSEFEAAVGCLSPFFALIFTATFSINRKHSSSLFLSLSVIPLHHTSSFTVPFHPPLTASFIVTYLGSSTPATATTFLEIACNLFVDATDLTLLHLLGFP